MSQHDPRVVVGLPHGRLMYVPSLEAAFEAAEKMGRYRGLTDCKDGWYSLDFINGDGYFVACVYSRDRARLEEEIEKIRDKQIDERKSEPSARARSGSPPDVPVA